MNICVSRDLGLPRVRNIEDKALFILDAMRVCDFFGQVKENGISPI